MLVVNLIYSCLHTTQSITGKPIISNITNFLSRGVARDLNIYASRPCPRMKGYKVKEREEKRGKFSLFCFPV
jgi:hypothetical protein